MRNSGGEERKGSREGKKERKRGDKGSGRAALDNIPRVVLKKWHIISPQARLSPSSHTIESNEVYLVCGFDEGISCVCMQ